MPIFAKKILTFAYKILLIMENDMDFRFLVKLVPSDKLQVVSIDWASFTLPKTYPHQSSTSFDKLFGLSDAEIRVQNTKAKIEFAKSQLQKQVGDFIVIASIDPNDIKTQRFSWKLGEMCTFGVIPRENEFIVRILLGKMMRDLLSFSWPFFSTQIAEQKVSAFVKSHFTQDKKFSSLEDAIQYAVNIYNQMIGFLNEEKDNISRKYINIRRNHFVDVNDRVYYTKLNDVLNLMMNNE